MEPVCFNFYNIHDDHCSGNIAQGDGASAHRILLGPGPCSFLIALPLVLVHVSDLWDKGIIWVGVGEERANREEDL